MTGLEAINSDDQLHAASHNTFDPIKVVQIIIPHESHKTFSRALGHLIADLARRPKPQSFENTGS